VLRTDGEGCFYMGISQDSRSKLGYRVKLSFQIGLHEKDLALLKRIKTFFGVGSIVKQGLESRFYSTNRKAKKVYNNADIEKEKIISNNNGKAPPPPGGGGGASSAGIYMFRNLVNKKRYVGSSVNIRRRMLEYFNINYLERNKNMPICRALLKYGYSNFSLEILEYCLPSDVISREQYYLDLLKPEYNILKIAGSSLGFKHSDESREKLSSMNKGKTYSEETRSKISSSQPNGLKIQVTDLEVNTSTIYNSLGAAARALKIPLSSISNYFTRNQKKPYKGIYTFKKF
jgi:hypothetical protein